MMSRLEQHIIGKPYCLHTYRTVYDRDFETMDMIVTKTCSQCREKQVWRISAETQSRATWIQSKYLNLTQERPTPRLPQPKKLTRYAATKRWLLVAMTRLLRWLRLTESASTPAPPPRSESCSVA